MNKTPQSVRERNPQIPADLERIIAELLEKDRELRYASAAELRGDLERSQTHVSAAAARGANPWRLFGAGWGRSGWRSRLLKYGIAAVATLSFAAGGFLWQQRAHARPLTDQDVLVLADFTNSTGDPVFDGTLRQGLAIQLEQSPFLKIMDDEQVRQDLRLMSLPPAVRITNQIAHDICVRSQPRPRSTAPSPASVRTTSSRSRPSRARLARRWLGSKFKLKIKNTC